MNDVCRFSRDHVVESSEMMGEVSPETSPNINKLVQDKIKLFFQNILQHDLIVICF